MKVNRRVDRAKPNKKGSPSSLPQKASLTEKVIQTFNYPLLVLNERLMVVLANAAFCRDFRVKPDEVNREVFRYAQENAERLAPLRARLNRTLRSQTGFENWEYKYNSATDGERILLVGARFFFRRAGQTPLLLLGIQDVTASREVEAMREQLVNELSRLTHKLEERVEKRTAELKSANSQLQTLSARLLEAQEMERRHLSRELHDEIGQQITCLQILVRQQLDVAPVSLKPALKETQNAVSELLQTVRQMSLDLRPQLLDDFGVLAALEWHFARFRKRTGIGIRLDKKNFREDLLNSFLRNVLFRVAQEALTNVARHARTDKVEIKLSTRGGICRMEVCDEGVGFNVQSVLQKESLGLSGMMERAFLAGGKLRFDSAPRKGTTVTLELPLISLQTDAASPEGPFWTCP